MSRLCVLLALLHHIEGVCKPWTAAGLAARRILDNLAAHVTGRDRQAAIERARAGQAMAVERARGGRQVRPAAADRRQLRALPAAAPRSDEVAEQLRDYQRQARP